MDQYATHDDTGERFYRVARSRRRAGDFGLRNIALAAGFMACLLVLGISVWSALFNYRSSPPPVIEAARGPVRVRPDNPGGMQMAGQSEDILAGDSSARVGQLAPPPEAPALRALRARQQAALANAAPPPSPAVERPPIEPPAQPPTVVAAAPPPAVTAPANPAPVPRLAAPAIVASAPAAPAIVAPAQQAANPPAGTAKVLAQLAAVASEQAARSEWVRLSKKMPDILHGREPVVMKINREGSGPLWRLRTGGFADRAQASAFCSQVKAKGLDCTVATF